MKRQELMKNIFAEFAEKRNSAVQKSESNKQKALQNPEYANYEKQIRALTLDIATKSFAKENVDELKSKQQKLFVAQERVLKQIGLTKTDLLPNYSCKVCNDSGIVNNEYCNCFKQAINNKLMKLSNINFESIPFLKEYDYNCFETVQEKTYAKKVVKNLIEFVNNFDEVKLKNIVLCGKTGTGKTYFTKCLAKELIAKNKTTLFVSAFDMNQIFVNEYLSNDKTNSEFQNIMDQDVLIIDDLGTEPIKRNITKEFLLLLINERTMNNKSTIITTNLNPDQVLNVYEERLYSRIFNKRTTFICNFDGADLRIKK